MMMNERSEANGRAQRALKALGEHPRSRKKELGHAREHLNACYSNGDGDRVWDSVAKVEAMATRRYGAPSAEEQRSTPERPRTSRSLRQPAEAATQRTAPSSRAPRRVPRCNQD